MAVQYRAPGAPRARDFSDLVEPVDAHAGHHHDHANGDHHGAGAHGDIRSFSVFRDGKVTFAGLEVWMGMLGEVRGPDLLRIKGIVNVGGRPIVIQAVQHMFHPLHELPEWPDDDRRSRLVFITRNVSREQIERTLDALSLILHHASRPRRSIPTNFAGSSPPPASFADHGLIKFKRKARDARDGGEPGHWPCH